MSRPTPRTAPWRWRSRSSPSSRARSGSSASIPPTRRASPPRHARGTEERTTEMIVIDHSALHDIAERVFTAAGSGPDEAGIIADYLVEANLRGHDSHGVGMIPTYLRNLANGTVF